MIEAFVSDPRERGVWLHMLDNCRGAVACPCTNTTPAIPVFGMLAGRPVSNCGLCYGTGVGPQWSR